MEGPVVVNHSRTRRLLAAITALTLTSTLVATTAAAAPSEEEIERSREAEASTSAQIASLEIELAEVSAQVDEAQLRAQIANEQYLRAMEQLEEAEADSEQAQEEADAALAELELARQALGEVATAAYRGGSGSLSSLQPFLSAEGFADAMARSTTVRRMGNQADEQVQRFQALEQVASTLERRADEAVEVQEEAADTLAESAEEAQSSADAAATQLALSNERRGQLIGQLAEQRNTTVELERERQESLDRERRERQEAAALAQAEAEERAQEAERAEAPPSRNHDRQPTGPSAGESETGAPETSGSGESTTGSTEPTTPPAQSTPDPEPTRTPDPTPTRTPDPTPTRTPDPEPKPEPPPAPPSSVGATALSWARTQIGKPYGWGAEGPNAYDCSGLTMKAFANAGRSIPRNSQSQYWATTRVSRSQLQPGDLIFYSSNGSASGIYHVAFYAGNGMRVHAPSPGKTVEQAPLWSSSNIIGYGRVL